MNVGLAVADGDHPRKENDVANPVMQPGDLRLYIPTDNLVAAGIEIGEMLAGVDGHYVHVGVVMDASTEVAAYQNGVQIGGLFNAPCDILRIENIAPRDINAALVWAKGKAGKTPYAYMDLLYLWFLRRFHAKGPSYPQSQMICSMLGAEFVRRCGLDPWPGLLSCEVAPGDFDGAKGLVKIGRWSPLS